MRLERKAKQSKATNRFPPQMCPRSVKQSVSSKQQEKEWSSDRVVPRVGVSAGRDRQRGREKSFQMITKFVLNDKNRDEKKKYRLKLARG